MPDAYKMLGSTDDRCEGALSAQLHPHPELQTTVAGADFRAEPGNPPMSSAPAELRTAACV